MLFQIPYTLFCSCFWFCSMLLSLLLAYWIYKEIELRLQILSLILLFVSIEIYKVQSLFIYCCWSVGFIKRLSWDCRFHHLILLFVSMEMYQLTPQFYLIYYIVPLPCDSQVWFSFWSLSFVKFVQPKKVMSFEDPKQRAWQWKKAIEGLQNRWIFFHRDNFLFLLNIM